MKQIKDIKKRIKDLRKEIQKYAVTDPYIN